MYNGLKNRHIEDLTVVIPSKNEDPKHAQLIGEKAPCHVVVVYERMYGEGIKEGIHTADTKYIITMDADGQHRIEDIRKLYDAFRFLKCDLLIGERRGEKRHGLRYIGSLLFNTLSSLFAGRWVVDLNSGMRMFRRADAISYFSVLCDEFSFTTSLAMSYMADGKAVEWVPITVKPRLTGRSSVLPVRHSLITLYYIFKIGIAFRTRGIRHWLRPMISRFR